MNTSLLQILWFSNQIEHASIRYYKTLKQVNVLNINSIEKGCCNTICQLEVKKLIETNFIKTHETNQFVETLKLTEKGEKLSKELKPLFKLFKQKYGEDISLLTNLIKYTNKSILLKNESLSEKTIEPTVYNIIKHFT